MCGGRFQVLSVDEKPGSVLADLSFSPDMKGRPGVWLKQVSDGVVHRRLCPQEGSVEDLLWRPERVEQDPRVEQCRRANPDDGPE